MEQDEKPRKAADIAWGEGEDDEGEFYWCEFIYRETAYSFKTSYPRLAETQWEDWSIENLFRQIGNDLDKHQHSSTLQDLLNEKAVTLRVFPAESWYEPGGILRELPKGQRRKPKELVAYFLVAVLQDYINHERDTPSKDELWDWLDTLCWRTEWGAGKWKVSGDPESGYTYARKSDGATSEMPMKRDSFMTQFRRTINTTSFFAAYKKSIETEEKIQKMQNKKPRGRPRKNPQPSDT